MPETPSSHRQFQKALPTPLVGDVIFSERVVLQTRVIPAYGTPHPNKARWPDHRLVFARERTQEPTAQDVFDFFYAADRANQDSYNFSHTEADIGGTKFDAVARTYVIPRADFTPDSPAMGASMPNIPAGLFTGAYVLAEKQQQRIGERELDSLYVAETRVYVRKVTLSENIFDERLSVNLQRRTTLFYRGEQVGGEAIEVIAAAEDDAYWGLQADKSSRSCQQLTDNWFAVVEARQTLRRDADGSLAPDWPLQQQKTKGQDSLIPAKFRRQVTAETTVETKDLAAADVDDIPEPQEITGDIVATMTRKVNDFRYEDSVTSETINVEAECLVGEEYGGIVTKEIEECLVDEGDLADTGIEIISSTVSPLGNGKAIKQTQKVKGDEWPDPVENTIAKSRENLVPQKFRAFITRLMQSRKVEDVPATVTLTGDEVSKEYTRETPDRVDEKVTTEVIDPETDDLEGENYGKIVTTTVKESLVDEGDLADTGLAILSSTVSPLGNGKAVKQTEEVKGGVWPDPVEETTSRVRDNLIPAKFRNFVVRSMESRKVTEVPGEVTLTGDEVSKEYTRETPDRVDEKVTTEVIDPETDILDGSKMFGTYGGGLSTTEESLETDGEEADEGFLVLASSVEPLGNGKSVRSTVRADEDFPELEGQNYDRILDIGISYTQQVVDAATYTAAEGDDLQPIDKWRSQRRTPDRTEIQTALDAIHIIYPTRQNVQLPNVLKSAAVNVTRALANGNSYQIGTSGSATDESTVSVSADLRYDIEEGFSGPVPAEVHVFFLPQETVDADAIANKVGAITWPVYRPKSHRVIINGHGLRRQWSVSSSSGGRSGSESSSVQAFSNVAVIPACIHDEIPLDIEYNDFTAPTVDIDAAFDAAMDGWEARLEDVRAEINSGFYQGQPITDAQKAYLLARVDLQEERQEWFDDLVLEDFPVEVHPATLPATNPSTLTAGKYVFSSGIEIYGYGRVKVTAVVIDLTTIIE